MEVTKTKELSQDKHVIRNAKLKFLNVICACLIHEPRYYSSADENKAVITALVGQVAQQDPEFILKAALYLRDDLNIRSTANFLVALAANNKRCQPFLKKYFGAITRLPSDMQEVVTLYIHLSDKYLPGKAIPTSLRKAVTMKFGEFNVYQLAKYNKEKAQKKKQKKEKEDANKMDVGVPKNSRVQGRGRGKPVQQRPVEEKPALLTLKQLIRKVHLAEPAEESMCILGKRYPATEEAFAKSGLKGEFKPERANKRMKLPQPETWEVLLSAKGNRHTTWQELLDHKKLPFMAMLRNLRNLIITGISPEHHEMVLNRLTDEGSVTTSRQLPWRFLSAYDAINIDLEQLMNDILDHDGSEEKIVEVAVRGKKGEKMGETRTIKKRVIIPVHMPDLPLIQKYREAIDTAIRISSRNNLKTIEGKTVVFCDVSGSMRCPCSTRGNMGSIQEVYDVAILLGLMLQDSCEECDFRIFSSPPSNGGRCDLQVPLNPNSILDNIKRVRAAADTLGGGTDFPYAYLQNLINKKIKIDNFIILSDMMVAPGHSEMEVQGNTVSKILASYRKHVNPDLLFVTFDLYGNGSSLVDINCQNPKNVLITGFSDNALTFIAEQGNTKQLEYVESIDEVKLKGKEKPQFKKEEGKQEAV